MHTSGSLIKTVIERVRYLMDVPDSDKFDDNYLVRNVIGPEYANLWNQIRMTSDAPILIRRDITLVAGTEYYTLPPFIDEVLMLCKLADLHKALTVDFRPLPPFFGSGPGWSLEGNQIAFRPIPQTADTWTLIFTPGPDVQMHFGTTGNLNANLTTFTLAASPSLGLIDKRPNAYVGQTLRILHTGSWQERTIVSHDVANSQVTVRTPFDSIAGLPTGTATLTYEVAPLASQSLMQALACLCALNITTTLNGTQKKYIALEQGYKRALKTICDKLGNLNVRTGKAFRALSFDNPDYEFNPFS